MGCLAALLSAEAGSGESATSAGAIAAETGNAAGCQMVGSSCQGRELPNDLNVSVAMCTYNGARFLNDQLESIASQSRLPDELILCDDCSSDDTVAIARA